MRKLTFKGFLSKYVKELSYSNTLDLKKLAAEVAENHRLRAPLVLYAIVAGKDTLLQSYLQETEDGEKLCDRLSAMRDGDVEQMLSGRQAPDEYLKVWNSYLVSSAVPDREKELKAAMRKKILQLQEEKQCSNYRVYRDLNLNPGNINSWLKYGDGSKVSYQTAERIVSYVVQYR